MIPLSARRNPLIENSGGVAWLSFRTYHITTHTTLTTHVPHSERRFSFGSHTGWKVPTVVPVGVLPVHVVAELLVGDQVEVRRRVTVLFVGDKLDVGASDGILDGFDGLFDG